jgi:hypothetical protein
MGVFLGHAVKWTLLNDFTRETLVIWLDQGFLMAFGWVKTMN